MTTLTATTSNNSYRILKKPGRYELQQPLSEGRFGSVYRARDHEIGGEVCIKLLRPVKSDSEEERRQFEQGARRLAALHHRNVADIHDYGHYHGIAYITTSEVAEFTLERWIELEGRLGITAFVPVVAEILAGLDAAHANGLVHGDVAASQIFLRPQGTRRESRTQLFGFCFPELVRTAEAQDEEQTTHADHVGAVAPERIVGRDFDERIDLYGLGVVAYRMLSGVQPFGENKGRDILFQHVHQDPPDLEELLPADSEVPERVVDWVHRLLAKDPGERPAGAVDAEDGLMEAIGEDRFEQLLEDPLALPEIEEGEGEERSYRSVSEESRKEEIREALPGDQGSTSTRRHRSVERGETAERGQSSEGDSARGDSWFTLRKAKWLVAGGGLVLCSLVGWAILSNFILGDGRRPGDESGVDVERIKQQLAKASAEERRERIQQILEKSRVAIENRNLQTANVLLELVGARVGEYPELRERVDNYEKRLEVAEKLDEAREFEEEKHIQSAMKEYHAVLSIDPEHEVADQRLEELKRSAALHLQSNVRGTVYVDGAAVGKTPVEKFVPAEKMEVEVRRSGYETWSTELEPDGGTRVEVTASLRKIGAEGSAGGGGASDESSSGDSDESSRDNSLMEMNLD